MPSTLLTLSEIPEGINPLYERIAEQIRTLIDSGHWDTGQQLLAEEDLARDIGVARGTLRKSIQALVASGYLVQSRGVGTFVADRKNMRMFHRLESLGERLERGGKPFSVRELSRSTVEADPRFDLPAGELAVHIRRLCSLAEGPVSVLGNSIPLSLAPGIDTVDLSKISLYNALETVFGRTIINAELTFSAVAADHELAALLDVAPGSPLLKFSQVTLGVDGLVLDLAETWIRPDRHQPTVNMWRKP